MNKQIEEMANFIHRTEFVDISRYEEETIAKELLKHYQPKLPEDSVVLTRKEWKNLHEEKNDYKQRFESSEKRYEQLVQSSCEALEKKSKETAREILNELKKKGTIHTEFDWNDYLEIDIDDLKELAKQFEVEIKE